MATNLKMDLRKTPLRTVALVVGLGVLSAGRCAAVSCVTQAAMSQADQDALVAAASPLASAIVSQKLDLLQSSLLPAVIPDWDSIRSAAQAAAPIVKGGTIQWRAEYLLDASDLKGPTDSQFFCTTADNSLTVTVNLRSLPPGKFALMLGDYSGAPLAGQLGFILGFDGKWKLGGLFVREGSLDGHDGIWYWTHARELKSKNEIWPAWFSFDTARLLLLPVDFLTSPNLDRLNREQESLDGDKAQLKVSPMDALPLTVTGNEAGKSWKINSLHLDTSLHSADIALSYESNGSTDQQLARAEAIAVMSALLKAHPDLRANFHGLWAFAEKDGKRSFALELAMRDIP